MSITPISAEAETVESAARVIEILERMQRAGCTLHVRVPGSDELWRTSISRAGPEGILYHQLTPATWKAANFFEPVEVHCMEPGCRVVYSATLTPVEDGSVYYWNSELPDTLRYHQLRKQFRISLATRRSSISLALPGGTDRGELINLSEGGCRARLPFRGDAPQVGQRIEDCHIRVEDLLELRCEVKVCHCQREGEFLELSLAFCALTPRDRQRLRRSMAALQRANLRQGFATAL